MKVIVVFCLGASGLIRPGPYPEADASLGPDGSLTILDAEDGEIRAYYPQGSWHHYDVQWFDAPTDEEDEEGE